MKHSLIQTENQFDTLRLHIPSSVISNPNWNNFQFQQSYVTATGELKSEKVDTHRLVTEHKGIDCVFVANAEPHFDFIISAKLLKDEYYKGISKETIKRLGIEIQSAGVTNDEIDMSEFLVNSQVLKADNTFNIKVDEDDIQSYYDSLELVISQGKKGKIETFDSVINEKCNGIVVGKDTAKLQKITIYNKIDEARTLLKKKYPLLNIEQSVEKEYGMKWGDFHSYFADRLRVELRVSDWDKLRKLYTNKSKGKVMLEDLIFSENNAILYQWRQFVNEGYSKEAIKFLDMTVEEKRNYKLNSFSAYANWQALKQYVKMFDGNEKRVAEKVQKIFYSTPTGYKKVSPSVMKDIIRFCTEFRANKQKAKRGELFSSNLTKRYSEIDKKISKL